ncbi:MAG TPA: S8 family serine peptidase [Candidatus Choladocola avistercoris]|nr:S8 family serine peptidase [Candidatus Choladocola avistercoris]
MDDQKIENQLNLALEATEEERKKSLVLETGYDPEEKTWELIVKYSGNLDTIVPDAIRVTRLINEYAILVVPESLIESLAQRPEIEYIEKPKRLFFARAEGKRASCMTPVQRPPLSLSGRGILVAVLDSGVDYRHEEFRNPDGSSRILAYWDQSVPGNPPEGYYIGSEFTKEQIDAALAGGEDKPAAQSGEGLSASQDVSGHGTGVLAIAAGNGGVAYESGILAVKLGVPREDGFPRTTELMQGLDYVIRKAREYLMPVAVNISFGNTYGSHTGSSLLETYMDDVSALWKSVICVGSGNEGAGGGHTSGRLQNGMQENVEFTVGPYELVMNLQIWKNYEDVFDIYLMHPNGISAGPFYEETPVQRYRMGNTEVLVYFGAPSPYSVNQEIYLDFIPQNEYVDSGIWRIRLVSRQITEGTYQMWMPGSSVVGADTRFLNPVETNTLTIPSTARKVITVGAYRASADAYADFSGRGETERKPSLVAPGTNILTASPGGGYVRQTGTSFATPFVTGAAALLMQYGITDGNDPYLYGEKVRAYLQRGAQPLTAFQEYPNATVGWGKLCVEKSIPN